MKGFITFLALFCLISADYVFADDNLYNPLISYKEQLKTLRRECQERSYDKDCARLEKKLGEEMEKLKELCRSNPNDERCGAVMELKKDSNQFQSFCLENPHAKKCVVRRTRARRREKMKRLFCNKNPDSARCQNKVKEKAKKGFASYCKLNPEEKRCKVYIERKNMKNPPKSPESHGF